MSRHYPRFVVLSIDSVPYGLTRKMFDGGEIPNLAFVASKAGLRKMGSMHPTVSCVTARVKALQPICEHIFGVRIDGQAGQIGKSKHFHNQGSL